MENALTLQESSQLAIQVDVANKYPRQLDTFVDDVFMIVQRDQDFAMSCIYCVPVGKQDDGSQKFAMGPGVRLSEEMQKYWKHLRVAVNCEMTNEKIIVSGLVMDCQGNNAETLVDQVECKGWTDRRKNLKAKAMQSIMKRDLRMSIIGKSYANELLSKIIDHLLQDKVSAWEYCKEQYKTIGVKEEVLLKYFKVIGADALTSKNIYEAIGIFNYLAENAESPDYVFGSSNPSSKPVVSPGEVKIDASKGGQGKKQVFQKKDNTPVQSSAPEVMDSEEFEKLAFSLSIQAGLSTEQLNSGLFADFSCKDLQSVKPELQFSVIDWLIAKAETPGA